MDDLADEAGQDLRLRRREQALEDRMRDKRQLSEQSGNAQEAPRR